MVYDFYHIGSLILLPRQGQIVTIMFISSNDCSIVLMSTLSATLFLGGWGMPEVYINSTVLSISSVVLAIKTCAGCFGFVWFRATLPRLRYDQLLSFCWTGMLPPAIALLLLVPSVLVAFDIMPVLVPFFLPPPFHD